MAIPGCHVGRGGYDVYEIGIKYWMRRTGVLILQQNFKTWKMDYSSKNFRSFGQIK